MRFILGIPPAVPKNRFKTPVFCRAENPHTKNKQNHCTMKYTLITLAALSGSTFAQTIGANFSNPTSGSAYSTTVSVTGSNVYGVVNTFPGTPLFKPAQVIQSNAVSGAGSLSFSFTGEDTFEGLFLASLQDETNVQVTGYLGGVAQPINFTTLSSSGGATMDSSGVITTIGGNDNSSLFIGVDSPIDQIEVTWTPKTGVAVFGNVAFSAPVPEPSSAALLGLGGLALILRRRK